MIRLLVLLLLLATPANAAWELEWYGQRDHSRYGWIWVRNDCAVVTEIDCLKYLEQVPIPDVQSGDLIKVIGRACATNNDLRARRLSVNWVTRLIIEPTSGNDFTLVDEGIELSVPEGHVGMKFNGNISPKMHHECREISTTWQVPENIGLYDWWYAKLVTRAHNRRWKAGDRLLIQADGGRVEVEVWLYRRF